MKSVHVLIYNIWNLPSLLTDGKSRERALKISQEIQSRNYFDIVIFNEAFVNKDILISNLLLSTQSSHTINDNNRKFNHVVMLDRKCLFSVLDSGVMIFSKYPILQSNGLHFSSNSNWDMFASKGALHCKLSIPISLSTTTPDNHDISPSSSSCSEVPTILDLDLFGTHMQAGHLKIDQISRKSQSIQLAKFINSTLNSTNTQGNTDIPPSSTPKLKMVVLAGDLNMGPVIDPLFEKFSPHYANKQDAISRSESYLLLRDISNLNEVDENSEHAEDIIRALVSFDYGGGSSSCKLGNMVKTSVSFEDWFDCDGFPLSDSPAVSLTIDFSHPSKSFK